MHNKSLTADNQATVVGGRNIGNEYFNAGAQTAFSDLDVLAVGPVVNDVSVMFDRYWNSDAALPMTAFSRSEQLEQERLLASRQSFESLNRSALASDYVKAIEASALLENLLSQQLDFEWGNATLLYDNPDKPSTQEVSAQTHLAPQLVPLLKDAQREVLVVSPYFVPGDALVRLLADLERRGVRVRILTNSFAANDVALVHAGYMRYREGLLRAGVELYEFKPEPGKRDSNRHWTGSSAASLHAKTMGADSSQVFVGSFNLDPRSVALNTEMGVLINSVPLATQMHDAFEQVVSQNAYQVEIDEAGQLSWRDPASTGDTTLRHEPRTSAWQRFVVTALSWIVPESML